MVTHPKTSIDPPFLTPPYAKSLANEKKIVFTHLTRSQVYVQNVQLLCKMEDVSIKQCLWYGTIYRSKNHWTERWIYRQIFLKNSLGVKGFKWVTCAMSAANLSLPPSPMGLSKLAWRTNNSTIRHTMTSNLYQVTKTVSYAPTYSFLAFCATSGDHRLKKKTLLHVV